MSATSPKEKTTDLPPRGPRNADPITDAAGAHPIEAGLGAAAGGAAAGFAAGVVGGPIGAVAGAVIGGLAGGLAGKATGEWIDPTSDPAFRNEFTKRPYVRSGETFEDYTPVYQYGGQSESAYVGRTFGDVESNLKKDYERCDCSKIMSWNVAKPAVEDAFNKAKQIRDGRATQ